MVHLATVPADLRADTGEALSVATWGNESLNMPSESGSVDFTRIVRHNHLY